MKKFDPFEDPQLDAEEREILESVERGEWVPVKDMDKWRAELSEAARNTLRKNKRINIRLSAKDLGDIQTAAIEEGIPYQTLISSIIHKYASGSLIDRRALVVHEASRSDSRVWAMRRRRHNHNGFLRRGQVSTARATFSSASAFRFYARWPKS